ncbi:MAG TPA: DUF1697 domain-containing protein [Solirubrobacterales bacterium]|nr:DUF1697 domain-containing protein [Solirubrobacterales bacterium]
MSRHVAFLRGVNLGAKRRASSGDLRAAFGSAGFVDVATFRTSGNVVFDVDVDDGTEAELVTRSETALREALGFEVRVVLRSAREVKAVAAHQPFDAEVVASTEGRLQVILMAEKPSAGVRKQVLALATDNDRLALRGRELYWLPTAGTQGSGLDQEALGAALGLITVRTKGTIEQLAAKFLGD